MTEKSSSAADAWTRFWLDAQRRYWESWSDFSRNVSGEGRKSGPEPQKAGYDPGAWVDFWISAQQKNWDRWFAPARQTSEAKTEAADESVSARLRDHWIRLWMPLIPEQSRESIAKLLDANEAFFRIGEGLWKTMSPGRGAAQSLESQWDAFNRDIRRMRDRFGERLRGGNDPWTGFATFWGMPVDNWRRVCSAFSVLPGDMGKAEREFGSPYDQETLRQGMIGFLSMPTLGYTREWQEELQHWGLLSIDYYQALQEYVLSISGITAKAIELFGNKLYEKNQKGESIETLRAYYDLWIDCCEATYTQVSTSPEFTQAQTRLANAVFAVKRQEQNMVEEVLGALNMPTRRELDTSHRRVHRLRRHVWQLEQRFEESGALELRAEITALRRDLEALRGKIEDEKDEAANSPRKTRAKTST
ncbi:class III poly(R)-hydroxyalkanoic acid synthase subunit PhaE [Methylocaldum sp. MU1018]